MVEFETPVVKGLKTQFVLILAPPGDEAPPLSTNILILLSKQKS